MEVVKDNYYEVGSKEDIVISNTSLSYINPLQGGSPAKFLNFFDKLTEFLNSIQLERGSLLHDYHEHQENFVISDVEKPSIVMAGWCERIYDVLRYAGLPEKLTSDIIEPYANGAFANTKDLAKRLKKFEEEGKPYLDFLFKADGKIAMTPATKEIVVKSMEALKSHKKANNILFGDVSEDSTRIKELEVYWETIPEGMNTKVRFKAKIDNIVFNWKTKTAYLNDLKSTGRPVSQFMNSFVGYRYYRQLAFYVLAVFQHLIQQGHKPEEWSVVPRVIAVDSTQFYNVHSFTIHEQWMTLGANEVTELVNRVIWHIVNSEWRYTAEEGENKYDMFLDFTDKDKLFNGVE